MSRKKKSGGGGANWMDTYGDMVTLLLCFFVLLYSMSTIDSDKWKAIVMSFNPFAVQTPTDPKGNSGLYADPDVSDQNPGMQKPDETEIREQQEEIEEIMENLYQMLQSYSQQEGMDQVLSVSRDESGRVFIRFNQTAFFNGDSPVIRQDAYPILEGLCSILNKASDAIDEVRVLGHTAQADPDSPNPIDRDRHLASDRADNVVIYVQTHTDLHGARLVVESYGQWRPEATNQTAEGRAQNRRVEMIISGRNIMEELKQMEEDPNSSVQHYTTMQ